MTYIYIEKEKFINMDFQTILLLFATFVAFVSLVRIRLMFMLKGKKVNAYIKDYVMFQGNFIPVMEFEFEGQSYAVKNKGVVKKDKYAVGSQHEIYFIPGDDKYVKITSDKTDIKYAIIFLVLGVVLAVCSILK